jgi:hypothetical protein
VRISQKSFSSYYATILSPLNACSRQGEKRGVEVMSTKEKKLNIAGAN